VGSTSSMVGVLAGCYMFVLDQALPCASWRAGEPMKAGASVAEKRAFRDTVNSVTVQFSVLNSRFRKPARISGCARHAWWSSADSCCDAVAVCLPVLLCGQQ